MRATHKMELSFPSVLGYEIVARDAVAAFARCAGFARERIDDLKTALSEACINAIEHGNMLQPGLRVRLVCERKDDHLLIHIYDHGEKDCVTDKRPLSISEKLAGLGPLRGMGLMLITELSDEAGFVPVEEGNCFRMRFSLQAPFPNQPSVVDSSDTSVESAYC